MRSACESLQSPSFSTSPSAPRRMKYSRLPGGGRRNDREGSTRDSFFSSLPEKRVNQCLSYHALCGACFAGFSSSYLTTSKRGELFPVEHLITQQATTSRVPGLDSFRLVSLSNPSVNALVQRVDGPLPGPPGPPGTARKHEIQSIGETEIGNVSTLSER